MSFNVFISYSTKDVEIIKPLVTYLSKIEETDTFFAEETINPGDKISQKIITSIKLSDLFLVFFSKSSAESNYVQQEIGVAIANEKIIVPILLDSTKPTGMLADRNYLNFHNPEKRDSELKRLLNFISSKIQSKNKRKTFSVVLGGLALVGLLIYLCSKGGQSGRKEKIEQGTTIEFEAEVIDSLRVAILKIGSSDIGEVEIEDSVIENFITERLKVKGIEDLVDIKGSQEILLTSDNLGNILREGKEHENLLAQLILNILNNKIRIRFGRNLTKSKSFRERLDGALSEYNMRFITTAQLIEKLIEIGEDIDKSTTIYENLELSEEEEAFYDILATQKELAIEDPQIQKIVKELIDYLKKNTKKIDWYNEESFKTTLKEGVKDILRKYGFKTKQANLIIPSIMKQTESTFGENLVEI